MLKMCTLKMNVNKQREANTNCQRGMQAVQQPVSQMIEMWKVQKLNGFEWFLSFHNIEALSGDSGGFDNSMNVQYLIISYAGGDLESL